MAKLAKIDPSTISRMESTGERPVRGWAATIDVVVKALELKGVLIEPHGVRLLRKRKA